MEAQRVASPEKTFAAVQESRRESSPDLAVTDEQHISKRHNKLYL
jgi:hypothetical protein